MNTKTKRSTATWIWDFAGGYRSRYVLSVLSAVCGVICGILPYFVMANMIGDLLGGCRDMNIYLQHCLVMALLWARFLGRPEGCRGSDEESERLAAMDFRLQ